jgi:hypothetical protein
MAGVYANRPFCFVRKIRFEYLRDQRAMRLTKNSVGQETSQVAAKVGNKIGSVLGFVDWQSVLMRIAIAFVAAAWVAVYPVYLFVIYMHERHFFSYDFFAHGVIGIKSFFLIIIVLLAFLSVFLWGWLLFAKYVLVKYVASGSLEFGDRVLFLFLFSVAALFHFMLWGMSLGGSSGPELYVSWAVSSFIVAWYASTFVRLVSASVIFAWKPTAAFLGVTLALPIVFAQQTANVIEVGLRNFGVGGEGVMIISV